MISTQMGKPAFVARLIPVYSLTAEFLFDQVSKLIEIIHENSGFLYMAMNENLRANQKMFSIFHKTYKPRSLFSIAYPIPNDTIDEPFLLYPMIQLMNLSFYTQWYNWWTFSSIPNDTIDEPFLLYPMIQLTNLSFYTQWYNWWTFSSIPNDTIDEPFLLYPMIQLMNLSFYTQWYNWWTFSSIPNDTIDELFLLYPMIQLMNFFFYTQWYNWWTFPPIPNDTIDELFLLYDPTHLLKNIRNIWCTEKLQKLKYTDPKTKEVSIACWKDLIQLYNCECESIVKQTQLNFPSLYPTNFEKQKFSLALRVFNEKTVNFKISKIWWNYWLPRPKKRIPWKFQTKIAISGEVMTDFVYFGRLGPIWGSMTSSVVRNFKISRVKYHHRITGPNYVLPENFSLECAFLGIFHIWGFLGDDGVINCPEFWYSPTTTCKNSFYHPMGTAATAAAC